MSAGFLYPGYENPKQIHEKKSSSSMSFKSRTLCCGFDDVNQRDVDLDVSDLHTGIQVRVLSSVKVIHLVLS
jgi:hypothetical protein